MLFFAVASTHLCSSKSQQKQYTGKIELGLVPSPVNARTHSIHTLVRADFCLAILCVPRGHHKLLVTKEPIANAT